MSRWSFQRTKFFSPVGASLQACDAPIPHYVELCQVAIFFVALDTNVVAQSVPIEWSAHR
jgi:hypothetical protein